MLVYPVIDMCISSISSYVGLGIVLGTNYQLLDVLDVGPRYSAPTMGASLGCPQLRSWLPSFQALTC
jgi:predicted ATP-grasp superfamily ATP-dependent carboligase